MQIIFYYFSNIVYVSKVEKFFLLKSIIKVYKLEKTLSQSDEKKRKLLPEKWKTIQQNL